MVFSMCYYSIVKKRGGGTYEVSAPFVMFGGDDLWQIEMSLA